MLAPVVLDHRCVQLLEVAQRGRVRNWGPSSPVPTHEPNANPVQTTAVLLARNRGRRTRRCQESVHCGRLAKRNVRRHPTAHAAGRRGPPPVTRVNRAGSRWKGCSLAWSTSCWCMPCSCLFAASTFVLLGVPAMVNSYTVHTKTGCKAARGTGFETTFYFLTRLDLARYRWELRALLRSIWTARSGRLICTCSGVEEHRSPPARTGSSAIGPG